jgi:hypothetical protein
MLFDSRCAELRGDMSGEATGDCSFFCVGVTDTHSIASNSTFCSSSA